jgi:hypothetical protein
MSIDADLDARLRRFVETSGFAERGAVVTDLDGTAVHEHEGRVVVARSVEFALKRLRSAGRPLVINSLRFPLSVLRSFGREWTRISDAPLPTVSLNGSLLGRIVEPREGDLAFEEIDAFPLRAADIDEVLAGIEGLLADRVDRLLVFWYPRDWRCGERIWTPVESRIAEVAGKYRSAAEVVSTPLDALRRRLHADDTLMIFLLIDAPQERLMAYQHSSPTSFFTHRGVDKKSGTHAIAQRLGVSIEDSVGCGDTPMDNFLEGIGLAVRVGPMTLEFRGARDTIDVPDPSALGDALERLGALLDEAAR